MDHNGRNHRSNASTGNKNHINLLRYTAPAILCLKHKPIVLNSLAGHRKTFAWVVWYIPFKSQFQLNRNNWKYIVSFWCILFYKKLSFFRAAIWLLENYLPKSLHQNFSEDLFALKIKMFISFSNDLIIQVELMIIKQLKYFDVYTNYDFLWSQ